MAIVYRTKDEILPALVAGLVVRGGLNDIANSSNWLHIATLFAREIEEVYYQVRRLTEAFSVLTASGSDLDERAADYGLTREGALRAIGQVVASRAASSLAVDVLPNGQIMTTSAASGAVAVRAIVQGQVTSTSPERISGHGVGRDTDPVSCVAVDPGAAGNVPAGAIVKFSGKPAGLVEVTNISAFTGGRDAETDDEFRARIVAYIKSLPHATVAAIEAAALGTVAPSGRIVRSANLYEDPVTRGEGILYVDDGVGTAETSLETAPTGIGGAISAPVANVQTLGPLTTAPFPTDLVGRNVVIAGAANGVNNGTFPITAVAADGRSISYTNAAGVVEAAFAGTWTVSPEIVTAGAVGGENFLRLDHYPVRVEAGVTIRRTRAAVTTTLTLNDPGANGYYLDESSGWIYFPTELVGSDIIDARYRYFTDLIATVQKIVDGDPEDREAFPGYRPAGSQIRVLAPVTIPIDVECKLILVEGADRATAIDDAETAITGYINGLGISGDVIRYELVQRIMEVTGVYDVELTLPASNVAIRDDEIARVANLEVI